MDPGEKSFNPKQAREQKLRRDRGRKDSRRPGNETQHGPKGQREQSGRPQDHKAGPPAEPRGPASKAAPAESTEPPELPDFSGLKRETDEIAALTSRKYAKRQVFSNWTKYETPAVPGEDEAEGRPADFEDLARLPASAGSHFKFKSERGWDADPSLRAQCFSVNVELLAQGLACVPLYDKLELSKDMLTAEELERIDYSAKQSVARYSVAKASLGTGSYAQDAGSHIDKILNVLSYKENRTGRKTDPSMYENVDEDDQLENKSLVRFSFEASPAEKVEVPAPARGPPSRDSTPTVEERETLVTDTTPARGTPEVTSSPDPTAADVPIGQNPSSNDARSGNTEASVENHTAEEPPDSTTCWEEEKPAILEQRTARSKKGASRGKSKNDEKKGRSEENNNVENERLAEVEAVNSIVVVEVERPAQPVAEVETKKIAMKPSKYSKREVVEEGSKPVEQGRKEKKDNIKKSPRVDEDLDFLLSLKKPVEDVRPKIAAPGQVVRSAIDMDEADGRPLMVAQRANEENLEAWLDSMLDD